MSLRFRSVDGISRIRTDSPIRVRSPGAARRNLTVKQKLALVSLAENTNPYFAANHSGINPSTAYYYRSAKQF